MNNFPHSRPSAQEIEDASLLLFLSHGRPAAPAEQPVERSIEDSQAEVIDPTPACTSHLDQHNSSRELPKTEFTGMTNNQSRQAIAEDEETVAATILMALSRDGLEPAHPDDVDMESPEAMTRSTTGRDSKPIVATPAVATAQPSSDNECSDATNQPSSSAAVTDWLETHMDPDYHPPRKSKPKAALAQAPPPAPLRRSNRVAGIQITHIQVPQKRNSHAGIPQPFIPQGVSASDRTTVFAAQLDPGFMPSADNDFGFVYDSPSGMSAAQLDQLLKPPARPQRDPRDIASLKNNEIKMSFTKLGTMPAPGLAEKRVKEMEAEYAAAQGAGDNDDDDVDDDDEEEEEEEEEDMVYF
ncbi:hypothetical protein J1614_001400 [Plenodomus biglobosus]|nr:hypothetical protein J1614_001400 [Plenodomus biglobosus]